MATRTSGVVYLGMAQTGTEVKKWCSFLVWTMGDFEQAKEAEKALRSEALISWHHAPCQPETSWLVPVASEVLTSDQIEEVLKANKDKYELWWEGPYYNDKLEDDPYYPHKCDGCGAPTQYKYRSVEFLHPTDDAQAVNIPDDDECDATPIRIETYGAFVYICFSCLEGYIGDNEMTTGGTGLWMAG